MTMKEYTKENFINDLVLTIHESLRQTAIRIIGSNKDIQKDIDDCFSEICSIRDDVAIYESLGKITSEQRSTMNHRLDKANEFFAEIHNKIVAEILKDLEKLRSILEEIPVIPDSSGTLDVNNEQTKRATA